MDGSDQGIMREVWIAYTGHELGEWERRNKVENIFSKIEIDPMTLVVWGGRPKCKCGSLSCYAKV